MNIKRFLGCPESSWVDLVSTLIKGNNMAMTISKGDDIMYCEIMSLVHDTMLPLYVDSGQMELSLFNKLFCVFVYVVEFKYGDPYYEGKKTHHHVTPQDMFNEIKKCWNVDIEAELNKANKRNAGKH